MRKYGLVEALKTLRLNRDRLHYWIKYQRLTMPIEPGKGRGAKTKLSFENLFELTMARELSDLGIELNVIKGMLETQYDGLNEEGKPDSNIKVSFAKYAMEKYETKTISGTKEECLFLQFTKHPIKEHQFLFTEIEFEPDLGKAIERNMYGDYRRASIILDVFGILEELEKATGEKVWEILGEPQ